MKRRELRRMLSEAIGDSIEAVASKPITDDLTIFSSDLQEYAVTNDYFRRWYCLITSGNNIGEIRKIKDSDRDGTLVLYGTGLIPDIEHQATFEVHRYSPEAKNNALNQAGQQLYPNLIRNTFEIIETNNTGNEYLLPDWANNGMITWVHQVDDEDNEVCPVWKWRTVRKNDGVTDGIYLQLPSPNLGAIKVSGYTSLETAHDDNAEISIEMPHVELLIAYAAHLLFEREAGSPSSYDREFVQSMVNYWWGKAEYLKGKVKMPKPQGQTRFT